MFSLNKKKRFPHLPGFLKRSQPCPCPSGRAGRRSKAGGAEQSWGGICSESNYKCWVFVGRL